MSYCPVSTLSRVVSALTKVVSSLSRVVMVSVCIIRVILALSTFLWWYPGFVADQENQENQEFTKVPKNRKKTGKQTSTRKKKNRTRKTEICLNLRYKNPKFSGATPQIQAKYNCINYNCVNYNCINYNCILLMIIYNISIL